MKPVKNTLSESVIKAIPETAKDRRIFLKKHLAALKGKHFFCPALQVNIEITSNSISETAENAALSKKSTVAALNLGCLIENSVYEGMDIPKSNKQKKAFQFIFVYRLSAILEGYGKAKIMVGVRQVGGFLHYSVTIPDKKSAKD